MLIKPSLHHHQLSRAQTSSPGAGVQLHCDPVDRFERQDQAPDTLRQMHRQRTVKGQIAAVAGASVLVTSLALAATQAIAAGSAGMSAAMAIPLGVTGTLGITLLTAGLHLSGPASR
jgi:hypothetical protein